MLNEELLSVWLQLTNVIDNHRLTEGHTSRYRMPFNEALVCGLLAGGCRTASDLCAESRILKSQMTAILRSLEEKGVIQRRRSQSDRRRIELRLLPEGCARYDGGHRQALDLADRLISAMGEEKIRQLIPLLRQVTEVFDQIQQEV